MTAPYPKAQCGYCIHSVNRNGMLICRQKNINVTERPETPCSHEQNIDIGRL